MGTRLFYSKKQDTFSEYLQKVWKFRFMILLLARRDLKIKYARTSLGLIWSVVQPMTGLVIFYLFFNYLIAVPSIPDCGYTVFAFSGMTAWYFFSYIVYQGSNALIQGQELSQKIYFPRIALPISKVMVGSVDLLVALLLLLIVMLILSVPLSWHLMFLPLFVLINAAVGLSIAIWISALTVKHRDLQHIVPYIVNFGIWLTPVFFPASIVPGNFSWMLYLNPMSGVIEGFRWCLWGHTGFLPEYFTGIGISLIVLVAGIIRFNRTENNMMDII